ncbi:MAG TPA: hypothetical protein VM053_07550 [Gemmatimonadaceae bacterium]|nr:hypothetical protein [Gemmatimonadaceae bacterium]
MKKPDGRVPHTGASVITRVGRASFNRRQTAIGMALLISACTLRRVPVELSGFTPSGNFGERVRVLDIYPGVTATIVAPAHIDDSKPVDLIIYALPNGNTTAQTIGRKMAEGLDWHFDIQHIGAQTRALRTRGVPNAIVAYLEADTRSWPSWRSSRSYPEANARIVAIVDQLRAAAGNPANMRVTLTGHSGGGSFMFGFIEGQDSLPSWVERIAFLDANYNFDYPHGEKLVKWLRQSPAHTLVVVAYDDRNIMLDGKKVVSDSGGTWRASARMMNYLREPFELKADTLGAFHRYRAPQVDFLLHPNPANRILHTEMIGEMNAYMHAMLVRRPKYDAGRTLLKAARAYSQWVESDLTLPPATPSDIPPRAANAMGGSAFIASLARLSREEREHAIRRELLAGNMPSFLRKLRAVEATTTGSDGLKHTISYEVMPDYLAIGSDDDFVRMPMTPYTAQDFCDAFGFVLPTRKMVNDIWAASKTHLDPRPLTVERESPLTFFRHHEIIEEQLNGLERGTFVAGIKKDVVVTNRLAEAPKRVAIYGWHYPTGVPIQQVYIGHVDWYVDYSHGIRPVRRSMHVDGVVQPFEKIVKDTVLAGLLSDEGVLEVTRYGFMYKL